MAASRSALAMRASWALVCLMGRGGGLIMTFIVLKSWPECVPVASSKPTQKSPLGEERAVLAWAKGQPCDLASAASTSALVLHQNPPQRSSCGALVSFHAEVTMPSALAAAVLAGDKDAERKLNGAIYSRVMCDWLTYCLVLDCVLAMGEKVEPEEHERMLDMVYMKLAAIEDSDSFPACGVN